LIKDNFLDVTKRIEAAAIRANRKAEDIKLITVTKTIDEDRIKEALEAGAYALGENRVQEAVEKYSCLKEGELHIIGHLQKNKVKYIIDKAELIHSVESLELVKEIDKRAKGINKIQRILIEVNVSGEESKFGLAPCKVLEFVKETSKYSNVKVEGLMTVAPFGAEESELRKIFSHLKKISLDIEAEKIDTVSMGELSMGMTDDFEIAIEEGATMVRVGTGIFGKRNYA